MINCLLIFILLYRSIYVVACKFRDMNVKAQIWIGFHVFIFSNCLKVNELQFENVTNLTNFYNEIAYNPKYPFLEYMLKLQDSTIAESANSKQFNSECQALSYGFTTYHALVYVRVCVFKSKQKFNVFCRELQRNPKKLQSLFELLKIQNSAYANILDYNLFSQNLTYLQVSACHNIQKYELERKTFKNKEKKKLNLTSKFILMKYNENILEDVPFCIPFTCPYWKNAKKTNSCKETAYDCMPLSCKVIFWIIFMLDAVFAIAVIIANMIIIVVVKKTPHLLTSHG